MFNDYFQEIVAFLSSVGTKFYWEGGAEAVDVVEGW